MNKQIGHLTINKSIWALFIASLLVIFLFTLGQAAPNDQNQVTPTDDGFSYIIMGGVNGQSLYGEYQLAPVPQISSYILLKI